MEDIDKNEVSDNGIHVTCEPRYEVKKLYHK